jgi:hypothetical protein
MAKKAKQLCKWKQEDITKKFDKYTDIVRNPKIKKSGCTKQLHSSSKFRQRFFLELYWLRSSAIAGKYYIV